MEIDIIQIIIDLLLVWSALICGLSVLFIAFNLCITIFHFTLKKMFLKFLNWLIDIIYDTSFGNWMKKQTTLFYILIAIVSISLLIYSKGMILGIIPLFYMLFIYYNLVYRESSKELTSFLKKTGIALIVSFLIYYLLLDYSSLPSPDSPFFDGMMKLYITLYITIPIVVGVFIEWLIKKIIKSTNKGVRKISDEVDVELKKEAEQENKMSQSKEDHIRNKGILIGLTIAFMFIALIYLKTDIIHMDILEVLSVPIIDPLYISFGFGLTATIYKTKAPDESISNPIEEPYNRVYFSQDSKSLILAFVIGYLFVPVIFLIFGAVLNLF